MKGLPWLPPALWAAFILVLTSIPGALLPHVNAPGLDKGVHVGCYAVLGWFSLRALAADRSLATSAIIVAATIALFAALDEWHQQFIPGRSMDVADWVADLSGALVGVGVAAVGQRRTVSS